MGPSFGIGVTGDSEIRAENSNTHERVVVAHFYGIANFMISGNQLNTLSVRLPNRVAIESSISQFNGVNVVYNFTPKDDPADRENFRQWTLHPERPEARDWACKNILTKLDALTRESFNKVYGESFPSENEGPPKYCPDVK
jgi:hypothetical protein